ncbi:MAG: bile acid:sodium symporter family protein [Candidatus Methanomethylophilaceae archaeon]|nr:bile acid:sodium symporter family protein [Candidatus Methanomethylophilaceae archaeon]
MNVSEAVGRFMAAVVLMAAVLAFLVPATGLWISAGWIDWLLMAIMFGMGLTIRPADFKAVFVRPKDVAVGCAAQFTIMPLAAYVLCSAFGLEAGLTAGVILVGACPGGTASNVITYFAKGDVPFSVGMTAVNTLLAPLVTPLIVLLAIGQSIDVDATGMFLSMAKVVVLPLAAGFLVTHFLPAVTEKASGALPVVSLAAIVLIVMCVVSRSVGLLEGCGLTVIAVVVLHNLIGYAAGYVIGRMVGMDRNRRRTLSIEVGMQNSGLATSLAASSFPALPLATVPGAIFSVWHNVSGAVLAWYLSRKSGPDEASDRSQASRYLDSASRFPSGVWGGTPHSGVTRRYPASAALQADSTTSSGVPCIRVLTGSTPPTRITLPPTRSAIDWGSPWDSTDSAVEPIAASFSRTLPVVPQQWATEKESFMLANTLDSYL